jgi:hypothetical protein
MRGGIWLASSLALRLVPTAPSLADYFAPQKDRARFRRRCRRPWPCAQLDRLPAPGLGDRAGVRIVQAHPAVAPSRVCPHTTPCRVCATIYRVAASSFSGSFTARACRPRRRPATGSGGRAAGATDNKRRGCRRGSRDLQDSVRRYGGRSARAAHRLFVRYSAAPGAARATCPPALDGTFAVKCGPGLAGMGRRRMTRT